MGNEERIERTRLRYIESMQRVSSSLELIAFEHAKDLGPEDTAELIEIVTRLHRFIERVAQKTSLGMMRPSRLN